MMKKEKLIAKDKFLKKERLSYNSINLALENPYPNLEEITAKIKENVTAIDREIKIVNKALIDFNNYLKNKDVISRKNKINFLLNAILSLIGAILDSQITNAPINPLALLILMVILNGYDYKKTDDYIKNVWYLKLKGWDKEKLLSYWQNLSLVKGKYMDLDYQDKENVSQKLNEKKSQIEAEDKVLGIDNYEVRNEAIWQISAFRENSKFLLKSLNDGDYSKLQILVYSLNESIRRLLNLNEAEKIKEIANMENIITEIKAIYEYSLASDYVLKRKVGSR